ncbi:MAG: hypothetical protein EZS28_056028, partial [Streblomastix strix]
MEEERIQFGYSFSAYSVSAGNAQSQYQALSNSTGCADVITRIPWVISQILVLATGIQNINNNNVIAAEQTEQDSQKEKEKEKGISSSSSSIEQEFNITLSIEQKQRLGQFLHEGQILAGGKKTLYSQSQEQIDYKEAEDEF